MPRKPKAKTKRGLWLQQASLEYRRAFADRGRAASAAKRQERAKAPPSQKEISVCLRPSQVDELDAVCEATGLSRSFLIREAVAHWLKRWEEAKHEGRRYRAWGQWPEGQAKGSRRGKEKTEGGKEEKA